MAHPLVHALGHSLSVHRSERERPRPATRTVTTVAGLRFAFPRSTLADVHVLDGAGRRVRTLVSGELSAGEHECGWDGFDDAGRRCPAGAYVLRLETSGSLLTSRVVSLA